MRQRPANILSELDSLKPQEIILAAFRIVNVIRVIVHMEQRVCTKCKETKGIEEFYFDGGRKRSSCKICDNEKSKEYRKKNRDRLNAQRKEYHYRTYPDRKEEQQRRASEKARTPEYRAKNNARLKKRRDSDPVYRAKINMRRRCLSALKGLYKHGTTFKLVGCSHEELKLHIESLWIEGMNWDNYGRYGWHVDHIKPLDSFDLSSKEQQQKAFHYSNLQPLWWRDNISKGNKVPNAP